MTKKVVLGMSIAAIALLIIGSGSVFAESSEINFRGPGGRRPTVEPGEEPGLGLIEDYQLEFVSNALNVEVEDLLTRLENGEYLSQILLDLGVEDIWSLLDAAHAYAIEQLEADGITIPGWRMNSFKTSEFGNGFSNQDPSSMMGGRFGRAGR